MLQSLSPGIVETEMVPEEYLKMSPALKPEDIAAGVLYVLGAPPHIQVRALCRFSIRTRAPCSLGSS